MLRIGIIGLGDIALKAYLPVITQRKTALHLFTPNQAKLFDLTKQYRIEGTHESLDSLLGAGIDAAFVHSATATHFDIAQRLLEDDVHVFVDKPITFDFATSRELTELARRRNRILFVGFNRRYAPAYAKLKAVPDINMIIMQKNRVALPGDIRTFVFDDFIHVVDTLLFLLPQPTGRIVATGHLSEGKLYHLTVQFISVSGTQAIGIMNRNSASTEESIEVFSPSAKHVVRNLTETSIYQGETVTASDSFNWDTTLFKRGFPQMVDHYLAMLSSDSSHKGQIPNVLDSHQVCEEIVAQLKNNAQLQG